MHKHRLNASGPKRDLNPKESRCNPTGLHCLAPSEGPVSQHQPRHEPRRESPLQHMHRSTRAASGRGMAALIPRCRHRSIRRGGLTVPDTAGSNTSLGTSTFSSPGFARPGRPSACPHCRGRDWCLPPCSCRPQSHRQRPRTRRPWPLTVGTRATLLYRSAAPSATGTKTNTREREKQEERAE